LFSFFVLSFSSFLFCLDWIESPIIRELNDRSATMSVRVVARIRPLLKSERDVDVILRTGSSATADSKSRQSTIGDKTEKTDKKLAALRDRDNVVRIPNPKNEGEEYAFQFNGVYDAEVSQQELFDAEGEWLQPCGPAMRRANVWIGLKSRQRSSIFSTDSM
jgi:hypothetical protein